MKLWLISFALILSACQKPPVSSPPSLLTREQFCRRAADRVLRVKPKWRLQAPQATPLVILTDSDVKLEVRLDHVYDLYCQNPDKLESLVKDAEKGLLGTIADVELKLTWPVVRAYLMPRVMSAKGLDEIAPEARPAYRPMSKDLVVVYYYDHPQSPTRISITPDIMREWKVSPEQVHRQAVANLEKAGPVSVEQLEKESVGIFYVMKPDDDYGASRILVPACLEKLSAAAGGDVKIWVPTRDLLWAVRADNRVGADCLQQVSGNLTLESAEPLWSKPLLYRRAKHRLEPL